MNRAFAAARALAACLTGAALLGGCASLDVTHVTYANDATAIGQRYYLPKPVIIVAPQADGSIAVTVDYLPDRDHQYAINSTSQLSAYTLQVSTDVRGLLTAVEYKASTTAVLQQAAASAGGAAVQMANLQSAQLVAVQGQVNTAQTALEAQQALAAAAHAQLTSDQGQAAGVITPAAMAADEAAAASADAKVLIDQQAVTRAQATAQVVNAGASASTPLTTTAPAMGTLFGPQTWTAPSQISLPDKYGAVIYLVNDNYAQQTDGKWSGAVTLQAQTATLQDTIQCAPGPGAGAGCTGAWETGVVAAAQPIFATATTALGPPSLLPPNQVALISAKTATFFFDRPIVSWIGPAVETTDTPPVAQAATPQLSADNKTVTVDVSKLAAGSYYLKASVIYAADSSGHNMTVNILLPFTAK